MKLKQTPELSKLLSTYFSDTDSEADEQSLLNFQSTSPAELQERVVAQIQLLLNDPEFPVEEICTEANRWFDDIEATRGWLRQVLKLLEGASKGSSKAVKDSNGTVLSEGDAVSVIKDLKVKGGSSDLKRGTLIKKIHLIEDQNAIECRVDGSTLVLKTCFLKKA